MNEQGIVEKKRVSPRGGLATREFQLTPAEVHGLLLNAAQAVLGGMSLQHELTGRFERMTLS